MRNKIITFGTEEQERWYKMYEELSKTRFGQSKRPFYMLIRPNSRQDFADLDVEEMKEIWKLKTSTLSKRTNTLIK